AADPKYDLARDRLAALSSGEQMVRLEPPAPDQPILSNPAPILSQDDVATPIVLHPPAEKVAHIRARTEQAQPLASDLPLKPSLGSGQGARRGQVQLGAWRSEAEANQGWDRALQQAGDTLKGFSPHIMAVELPKVGRYYRLRVAAGETGAKGLCETLAAKGLECMPVRD